MEKLNLVPFTVDDFQTLISWVPSPEFLYQFAGPQFEYPLTASQLSEYIQLENKKSIKMIAEDAEEIIAHGELNFTNPSIPRLSRIVVNPRLIGKGYGKAVTRLLATELFMDVTIHLIDLNVFEWNKSAIACYQKVGFEIKTKYTTLFKGKGIEWTRLNLQLTRENFKKL